MISLIIDEFIHAIDFSRNIIEMRRILYGNLTALMFSSDLDVLLKLESFDSLLQFLFLELIYREVQVFSYSSR